MIVSADCCPACGGFWASGVHEVELEKNAAATTSIALYSEARLVRWEVRCRNGHQYDVAGVFEGLGGRTYSVRVPEPPVPSPPFRIVPVDGPCPDCLEPIQPGQIHIRGRHVWHATP